MKLAKYRSLDAVGIEIILQVTYKPDVPGYQRLSEVVDVEFPPIAGDDVANQISAIDAARRVIEKKYDAELARLDDRKAELQASLPECICLNPMDVKPGHHHSLACPARVEGVSA